MHESEPLAWSCRYCDADPGQACRTLRGTPAAGPHADRRESVRLWLRYGQGHTEPTRRTTGWAAR